MRFVALFILAGYILLLSLANVVTRKAALSENIKKELPALIEAVQKRDIRIILKGGYSMGIEMMKNRFVQLKMIFGIVLIVMCFMAYASERMSVVSIVLSSTVAISAIIAYLWLKEAPTKSTVIGGILIVIGLIIIGGA